MWFGLLFAIKCHIKRDSGSLMLFSPFSLMLIFHIPWWKHRCSYASIAKKKKKEKKFFFSQSNATKQGMISVSPVAVLSVAHIFHLLWLLKNGVSQMDSEKMSQITARVSLCPFFLSIFSVPQLAQTSVPRGALECSCVTNGIYVEELGILFIPSSAAAAPPICLNASLTNQRHNRDFKWLSQACWSSKKSKTFLDPLRNLLLRQVTLYHHSA